ncbi:glycoside hydrolase family 13 protein [Calocera viscosa TUFC12733]|uniref:alpha-amylase n=1 Tax=Calocera viscosa (strain TUFC12733) TaxID=1330018 RepID=A0A167MIH7_CALVF|nr:glycoside hydrolase family 13 protein [Calocera viscosa TUFC12733]
MWWLPSFSTYFRNNDGSLSRMDIGPNGQNPTLVQFFSWHSPPGGRLYRDLMEEVPRLSFLGITCVWLPPPNKAMHREGHGYDAYDLWDLGEFDRNGLSRTRWGSKKELVGAISHANASGIRILIDAVLNHKMGADRSERFVAVECDPNDRRREISKPRLVEGWTAFDFPSRNGTYSSLRWTWRHFSGLDYDALSQKSAVFKICGHPHKGWSKNVDSENGNYDYLMGLDIDHSNTEVRQDLLRWGCWVLEETGAAGFRLDACKHIDRVFLRDFLRRARDESRNRGLPAIGELWLYSPLDIERYIRFFENNIAFFDVPLHYKFHRASKDDGFDLRGLISGTLLSQRPGDAVTFVDNHDTQTGGSLESWVSLDFKILAYTFILLWPFGLPCVFHGDLYGIDSSPPLAPVVGLEKLLLARRYLAYGPLNAYFDNPGTVGFVRQGARGHDACAVILRWAAGPNTKSMNVGAHNANSTWVEIFGHGSPVTVNSQGIGSFGSARRSVGVWMRSDAACRPNFL